jgi:HD-GYP domain-containing protein (c-di-GMP phosphodiesterase class II)
MQVAADIALAHHEWWDGSGYPSGAAGDDIPLTARIVAVADVIDALSSDRVYRSAWPAEEVLREITRQRGRQFDPRIADVCCQPRLREQLLATSLSRLSQDGGGAISGSS